MVNHRLLTACRDNDVEGARKALEQGAFLETRRPFVMRPKPPTVMGHIALDGPRRCDKKKNASRTGLTPLMYSSQNGTGSIVKLLLEARAAVNARDEDGVRALHLAAGAGSLEVCQLLIAHGAEKGVVDDEGRPPLDHVPSDSAGTRAERIRWEELFAAKIVSPAEPPALHPPALADEPPLLEFESPDDSTAIELAFSAIEPASLAPSEHSSVVPPEVQFEESLMQL